MKKDYPMVQCTLKKGNKKMVSWIPANFAKKGKIIKLKTNKKWSDGWEVVSAPDFKMPASLVTRFSDDYKKQRETSDI